MIRLRNFMPLMAVLAGTAILGAPTQARAGYAVEVFDDNVLQVGITTFISGNSLVFFGNTTHFDLTNGSGVSNNPGISGSSHLTLSSNENISTTYGNAGGSHTIQIVLSQTGWTTPIGTPLNLSSSAGGSFSYLTGNTSGASDGVVATYAGYLDNTNTLFGEPGAGSTPTQTAAATLTAAGTTSLVFSPGTSVNTTVPGGTPFSMTDVLTFTFTLDAGSGQDTANVSASTVASVPAPAGVVLALTGLPCLGMGAWFRRNRRQAV